MPAIAALPTKAMRLSATAAVNKHPADRKPPVRALATQAAAAKDGVDQSGCETGYRSVDYQKNLLRPKATQYFQ